MVSTTRAREISGALSRLRAAVTEEGIAMLRAERFSDAQTITQIGQELKDLEARLASVIGNGSAPASATSMPANRPARAYPRYVRQGDMLVKIGQRRDRKGTYEQKVTKAEFDEIVEAFRRIAGEKSEFEAADVTADVKSPAYQVYLVLGFLQEGGLVESPARGKYRLDRDAGAAIAQAWEQAGARG